MINWFVESHPMMQAFLATLFTWGVTAAGAASVFLFKKLSSRALNGMLGFAAGVMIAASYWSLLAPAIKMAEEMGGRPWLSPLIGFLAGGAFLWVIDKILPHLHPGLEMNQAEGVKTQWQRSVLLVLAITLHNIPEGMAIGVAFGALGQGIDSATLGGAVALAIGIGLQNFPEGIAVAVPLRREGMSRRRCFWYGQLSAWVEPVGAVLAAGLVMVMRPILPYALAFAAGAMIYVVVEELIPEAQREGDTDTGTIGAMLGFALMMTLDVALG
jgi:ZIP family zinc transporter